MTCDCVKCVQIRCFSGPHLLTFGLNTDTKYRSISSPNAGKYGPEKFQIWTLLTQWVLAFSVNHNIFYQPQAYLYQTHWNEITELVLLLFVRPKSVKLDLRQAITY